MVAEKKATVVAINDFKSQEEMLESIEKSIVSFKDGDSIEGKVVKVDRNEVLVDVQYKTEGIIPAKELSIKSKVKPEDEVKLGDIIDAVVLQKEDREGRLILSKKRAVYKKAWDIAKKVKEEDGIIQGEVIEVAHKGLIVDVGLRGFVPASQIAMRRVHDLEQYRGKVMDFKFVELDELKNNVVLSHKATIKVDLQVGQIRKGIVSSLTGFGAFIDLGGIDGLVHVSELSWNHIDNPAEILEVGQEVNVEVIEIADDGKIALSIKSTQEDPWQVFARNHAIGQIMPGVIVKFVTFGAFIKVADGIEGLVHISELSNKHITSANQIVDVGDNVFTKIVDIDLERRRISLSIKQANELTDPNSDEFDPALYGVATDFDENGNYVYPEGFDSETQEWKKGYEEQKTAWETNYLASKQIWESHRKFILALREREESIVEVEEVAPTVQKRTRKKTVTGEQSFGNLDGSTTLGDNADLAALKTQLSDEE
jgi:small subunit ribosomal protein S1